MNYKHEGKTYTIHDISVGFLAKRYAQAAVTYACDGVLKTVTAAYVTDDRHKTHVVSSPDDELLRVSGLVDEIREELQEACAVLRESHIEMN